MTHRAPAACAARGGDVVASDQQLAGSANCTVASGSGGSDRSWRGQNYDPTGTVAMTRAQFTAELIFQFSNYLQTLKYKMKAILMSKNIQIWHGGILEDYEQLFPLGQLPIPNRIQDTNFGIHLTLNLP
jgi:hypothetical protein